MATSPPPTQSATASGNRFARFTPENHSAPIWIASILSPIFACLILAVRLGIVKWNVHGLDDVLLTLAHLVGLGMWASLFSALSNGLGKALKLLSVDEISRMNQSYFASRVQLFIALGLSKCSVIVFIQAIFGSMENVLVITNITVGVVAVWGVAGTLAVSIGCSPDHIVVGQENIHCVNDVLRLKAVAIVDVITEIAIVLLPIVALHQLHMPRKRKLLVMLAFSFRIPNVITTMMHLTTYSDFIHHGYRGIAITAPVVWQNVLLSYNLMSATIPALKGFMKGFTTGGMGYTGDTCLEARSSGNSYKMRTIPKPKPKHKVALLPQDYPESAACVTSGPHPLEDSFPRAARTEDSPDGNNKQESDSIASHDSRKIMIRKDWEILRA